MVGHHEQRILLAPFAISVLPVRLTFGYPVGHRGSFFVIGEMLCQPFRVELDLPAGSAERVILRILVEVEHAGFALLPVGVLWDHVVALLLEFLERDLSGSAGVLPAELDPVFDALAARVLLEQAKSFGDGADYLVVALRFASGLYRLVLVEETVELAAQDLHSDVLD